MKHNLITRDDLIAEFNCLEEKFSSQKSDIADKVLKFDNFRDIFAKKLKKYHLELRQSIGEENPLHRSLEKTASHMDTQFDAWESQVAARAKGAVFREGFNDSLLVFIYGKVKSGKSSLGNYMAWGHSNPTESMKTQAKSRPSYFTAEQTNVTSGDKKNEAEDRKQFRVGATEATSSIQGFRLPGLTWIDSPGLHSVNASNGDLAMEYVEHADLILYTMHSQSPGRASDMREIQDLLSDNKKMMVLLTGSDTTDEDEDDNGCIITRVLMKSPKDKENQIAYVRSELDKLNQLDEITDKAGILTDVLPISVLYAETCSDPQAIEESGMGRLFTELKSISHSQALSLKLNAPMDKLRNSISKTIEDLDGFQESINSFAEKTEMQRSEIEQELISLGQEGRLQMSTYINQFFKDGQPHDVDAKIKKKLTEVLELLTMKIIDKIDKNQANNLQKAFNVSSLDKLPEYKETMETKEYFAGTKKGNKGKLGLFGGLIGGAIGFLTGGPPGAAIGASLGSTAGLAGSSSKGQYQTHEVVVGDNNEERRASAIAIYANDFPKILHHIVNTLYDPTRSGIMTYCASLKAEIAQLSKEGLNKSPGPVRM
ncbi:dynamin family protein [Castellaniella sp.]|uniref:dynamin family protein n=1 Tax=Castellaniella sp. TaxID=1955812 RepID=UPI002AFE2BFD|nr:dynamin family protein [Castellaniella sp.]